MASWCSFPSVSCCRKASGLISALTHLETLNKSPSSPSTISLLLGAVRLAVSILQASRRVDPREGVGRAPWELQHHLERLPGVPSWSHRVSGYIPKPNSSHSWLCFTRSPFCNYVSMCNQVTMDSAGKNVFPPKGDYLTFCMISYRMLKIDTTMSFLMHTPLPSLALSSRPNVIQPAGLKALNTVLKLGSLRTHILCFF